jgi:hypothetical protein
MARTDGVEMSLAEAIRGLEGLPLKKSAWHDLREMAQAGGIVFVARRSDRPNEGAKRLARSEVAYLSEPMAAELVAGILVSKNNVFFTDVRVVFFLNHRVTGPKTAKEVDRLVQEMESLGDDFPGERSRDEWIDTFGTSQGSYYRALARVGKARKYQN